MNLSAAGLFSGTPSATGNYSFNVRVTDSLGFFASQGYSVTIAPLLQVTTASLPAGNTAQQYDQALASSGGTPAVTWSLASGALPPGINLTAGGVLTGTPGATGTYSFTVKATDSAAGTPQTATRALSITVNSPITITTLSPLPGRRSEQALQRRTGTERRHAGLHLERRAATAASWRGPLHGRSPQRDPHSGGSLYVPGDGDGQPGPAGGQTFSLTIATPLVIQTVSPLPPALPGVAYSQTFAAAGRHRALRLVGPGRHTAGTIAESGRRLDRFGYGRGCVYLHRAGDRQRRFQSQTANASFSLVEAPPINITTTALPATLTNVSYSAAVAATGGTPPLAYALLPGPPANLNLNPVNGALTGSVQAAGSYNLVLQVTDSLGVQATRPLTLAAIEPLTIQSASLTAGVPGQPYTSSLAAAGGSGTYTWAALSALPPGLSLSAAGAVTGTPTAQGNFSFSVKASDNSLVLPQSATATVALTVTATLTITNASPLPAGW